MFPGARSSLSLASSRSLRAGSSQARANAQSAPIRAALCDIHVIYDVVFFVVTAAVDLLGVHLLTFNVCASAFP